MLFQQIFRSHPQRQRTSSDSKRPLNLQTLEGRLLLSANVDPMMDHDPDQHSMVQVGPTKIRTHHDEIPRFAAYPNFTAVQDGRWSDPSTWSRGQVPNRNAVVSIPIGKRVVYDVDSRVELNAVEIGGRLDFYRWGDTMLRLNELMVLPTGSLTIGNENNPMPDRYTTEIVFTDTPGQNGLHWKTGNLNRPGRDPSQYGNGLIVFGRLEIHGAEKTPFARATDHLRAGARSTQVDSSISGWNPGDTLVIPETAQTAITLEGSARQETETVRLASINDRQIRFDQSVAHDHLGISANRFGIERFPHIANISRNVILRSENPNGVRGHFAAMGNARVNISFAEFRALGRTSAMALVDNTTYDSLGNVTQIGTNQIARYPIHMHHTSQPFKIDGVVVRDGMKWGIAVHSSDNGLLTNNIVFDVDGAGIVTEDGSEDQNAFINNLVIKVDGGHQKDSVRGGASLRQDAQDRAFAEIGADGSGFWLRASEGIFIGNTVYDAAGYGFNFNGYYNRPWQHEDFQARQVDLFTGNETVASKGGLWLTWSQGQTDIDEYVRQEFQNFLAWHVSHEGVIAFHEANVSLSGITVIADPDVSDANRGNGREFHRRVTVGLSFENERYTNHNLRLNDIRVEGANIGIIAPTNPGPEGTFLGDAQLANYVNIAFQDTAPFGSFDAQQVEYLPSRVDRVRESHPLTVANIWREGIGILEPGWKQIGFHSSNAAPRIDVDLSTSSQRLSIIGTQTADAVLVMEFDDDLYLVSQGSYRRFDRNDVLEILFWGLDGNDSLWNLSSRRLVAYGGRGSDALYGGSASDVLFGGLGNDLISGGPGGDVLSGDQGRDRFVGDLQYDVFVDATSEDRLSSE